MTVRTNLATRPFYNERLAALIVGVLAVAVLALTLVNIVELVSLSGRSAELRREAAENDARTAELRRRAQHARASVNPEHFERVAAAAHEANVLIDGRTFSWTELFNRFEATLPPGVRITAVQPRRDEDGRFAVMIGVVAREVDEVNDFMPSVFVQPGPAVVATALGVAEHRGRDGAAVVRAVVVGYELAARVPRALGAANLRAAGLASHGVGPTFGSAAAAASLLGLPGDRIGDVLAC